MVDRQYSAMGEQQQATVTHADELRLPINLLPGEEEIKLKEGSHRRL